MPQNQPPEGGGHIRISSSVVAVIAGTAASEVEGTVFPANMLGKKKYNKGVQLQITDDNAVININLCVKFGCKIQEVAESVQKSVKTAVETMTGLSVSEVNVNVSNVAFNKIKRGIIKGKTNDAQ